MTGTGQPAPAAPPGTRHTPGHGEPYYYQRDETLAAAAENTPPEVLDAIRYLVESLVSDYADYVPADLFARLSRWEGELSHLIDTTGPARPTPP